MRSFGAGPVMELEMSGLERSGTMLRDAAARGEDVRPAMLRIRELLIEGHRRQFETKGAYLGTPWPANAPGTLANKARSGIPSLSSVMVESGDLEESLSGGRGSRSRVTRGSVSVGTSVWWAIFAIAGTSKGEPPRPPIGINEEEEQISLRLIEVHLLGRP